MNSDPLDQLWQSSANQPNPDAGRQLAAFFVSRAQRRRRRQAWWLSWTLLALAGLTVLAVVQTLRDGSVGGGPSPWPMLVLPWGATLFSWHGFRRERAVPAGAVLPLAEALAVVRASNRAERRRLLVIGSLLGLMLPLTALAVRDLHRSGQAAAHEAWSMAAVLGVGLGGGLTAVVLRHRRLGRERDHLAALQAGSEQPATH